MNHTNQANHTSKGQHKKDHPTGKTTKPINPYPPPALLKNYLKEAHIFSGKRLLFKHNVYLCPTVKQRGAPRGAEIIPCELDAVSTDERIVASVFLPFRLAPLFVLLIIYTVKQRNHENNH